VILFKGKIDMLSFIGFSGYPINRMLCLLFPKRMWVEYGTETPKCKRKKLALQGITIPLF